MKKKLLPLVDPRLAQAIARGAAMRRKLLAAEGGSLCQEEAARRLGISEDAVLERSRNGHLIAWREKGSQGFRFPVWQFHNSRVLEGFECVFRVLNAGVDLDDYGRMLFFLSTIDFLNKRRPLDCLRNGELEKVIQAAHWYCQK